MRVRTINKLIRRIKRNNRINDLQKDLVGSRYRLSFWWDGYGARWTMIRDRGRPGFLQMEREKEELSRFDSLREKRLTTLKDEKKSKKKHRRPSRVSRYGQRGI